ncbi:hypothetical protein Droror1_Dr00005857 [Drosera rotundifolia]
MRAGEICHVHERKHWIRVEKGRMGHGILDPWKGKNETAELKVSEGSSHRINRRERRRQLNGSNNKVIFRGKADKKKENKIYVEDRFCGKG